MYSDPGQRIHAALWIRLHNTKKIARKTKDFFRYKINEYRMVLKNESGTAGIRSLVSDCVPGAEQARLHGKEISFVLPRDQVTVFPPLFNKVSAKFSTCPNVILNQFLNQIRIRRIRML
jgi:hypothetical protein